MSTEMRRNEIKQKLYKLSRHATTVTIRQNIVLNSKLEIVQMFTVTIRQNIVPNSDLESTQMVQTSCNNAGNRQIVQILDVIHVSYKHLDVLSAEQVELHDVENVASVGNCFEKYRGKNVTSCDA